MSEVRVIVTLDREVGYYQFHDGEVCIDGWFKYELAPSKDWKGPMCMEFATCDEEHCSHWFDCTYRKRD